MIQRLLTTTSLVLALSWSATVIADDLKIHASPEVDRILLSAKPDRKPALSLALRVGNRFLDDLASGKAFDPMDAHWNEQIGRVVAKDYDEFIAAMNSRLKPDWKYRTVCHEVIVVGISSGANADETTISYEFSVLGTTTYDPTKLGHGYVVFVPNVANSKLQVSLAVNGSGRIVDWSLPDSLVPSSYASDLKGLKWNQRMANDDLRNSSHPRYAGSPADELRKRLVDIRRAIDALGAAANRTCSGSQGK